MAVELGNCNCPNQRIILMGCGVWENNSLFLAQRILSCVVMEPLGEIRHSFHGVDWW